MRRAVVDLGSNTMRMEIYDEVKGKMKHIVSAKDVVGLISYTEKGILSEEGMLRMVDALCGFRETADALNVEHICCFATAGLRAVKNADEAVQLAEERTGIVIQVISGEEEAQLDFVGAHIPDDVTDGLVVDMGGGSTEIVHFSGAKSKEFISLPYGSLYLYKRFVKNIIPTSGELQKIKKYVDHQLGKIEWLQDVKGHICLIGGTGRAIVRLHRDLYKRPAEPLDMYTFPSPDIKNMENWVMAHKKMGAKRVLRVAPERIHTILPGLAAIGRLIVHTGSASVSLSSGGVREGYIRKTAQKDKT